MAVMRINCPVCHEVVEAEIVAEYSHDFSDSGEHVRFLLLLHQDCYYDGTGVEEEEFSLWGVVSDSDKPVMYWSLTQWLYPFGGDSRGMPQPVVDALDEARKCYEAQAYDGCAAMCRKMLEELCKYHGATVGTLGLRLCKVCEDGVIDSKLLDWGQQLKHFGNIALHAGHEKVCQEDAEDLLDFAQEMGRYVFVLNAKFARFKERHKPPQNHDKEP